MLVDLRTPILVRGAFSVVCVGDAFGEARPNATRRYVLIDSETRPNGTRRYVLIDMLAPILNGDH